MDPGADVLLCSNHFSELLAGDQPSDVVGSSADEVIIYGIFGVCIGLSANVSNVDEVFALLTDRFVRELIVWNLVNRNSW